MLRDDLDLDHQYSLAANHSEEHGAKTRKKIWMVTGILTAITIVEVLTGAFVKQFVDGSPNPVWPFVKWGFILLTIVKAGYIVMSFMHLGDERKNFKLMVLVPYILFILYLVYLMLEEAMYQNDMLDIL